MRLEAKGREVHLSKEERDLLITLADQKQMGAVRVNRWQSPDGKVQRLYVEVVGLSRRPDKSYLDLKDPDDTVLMFREFASGKAVEAFLLKAIEDTQEAEAPAPASAPVPAIDLSAAPTVDEVAEAHAIAGFRELPATEDGQYLLWHSWEEIEQYIKTGEIPVAVENAPAAELRLHQMKAVWQFFVVGPILKALPDAEHVPLAWGEICAMLEPTWERIVESVRQGQMSWTDVVDSFRRGAPLRVW